MYLPSIRQPRPDLRRPFPTLARSASAVPLRRGREKREQGDPGVTLELAGNIVSHDIEAQCHSVFQNVRDILESWAPREEDLVDVTVFLTLLIALPRLELFLCAFDPLLQIDRGSMDSLLMKDRDAL